MPNSSTENSINTLPQNVTVPNTATPITGITDGAYTNDIPTLLKQYEIINDQFKNNLEINLKFLAFYLSLTGAIVSYYLSHQNSPMLKYSLLLPFLVGLWLGIIAINVARSQVAFDKELNKIAHKLFIEATIDLKAAKSLYIFSGILSIIISIGLIILFFLPIPL